MYSPISTLVSFEIGTVQLFSVKDFVHISRANYTMDKLQWSMLYMSVLNGKSLEGRRETSGLHAAAGGRVRFYLLIERESGVIWSFLYQITSTIIHLRLDLRKSLRLDAAEVLFASIMVSRGLPNRLIVWDFHSLNPQPHQSASQSDHQQI